MTEPASGAERAARPLGESTPVWRNVAFLIIVVTGLFHLGRGAPVDGVIFLGVAVALVVTGRWWAQDRAPAADPPSETAPRAGWTAVVLLGCLVYGWLVGHLARASVPVKIAVIIPGVIILPLALRAAWIGERRPVRSGWRPWALVGVLICLWELATFLQQPSPSVSSYDHPTLSVVLEPLFASAPLRSVLMAGWLLAGFFLLRLLLGALRSRR